MGNPNVNIFCEISDAKTQKAKIYYWANLIAIIAIKISRISVLRRKLSCTREMRNMKNTYLSYVCQWFWRNVRYPSLKYCEYHQILACSKGDCYHCKSEFAATIDIKSNCEIIMLATANKINVEEK